MPTYGVIRYKTTVLQGHLGKRGDSACVTLLVRNARQLCILKGQRQEIFGSSTIPETSVPDSDPPDSDVFGPPGSGSISQRYGSGSFYRQAKLVRKNLIPTVF